jgi:hypothetical protein
MGVSHLLSGRGRAQKNRFENRSGDKAKNQKNEGVNGRNNLPVVSQNGLETSPTLHQGILIRVKHEAKVPKHFSVTKQLE